MLNRAFSSVKDESKSFSPAMSFIFSDPVLVKITISDSWWVLWTANKKEARQIPRSGQDQDKWHPAAANQRPVFRSRDLHRPIRGQWSGNPPEGAGGLIFFCFFWNTVNFELSMFWQCQCPCTNIRLPVAQIWASGKNLHSACFTVCETFWWLSILC